MTSALGPETCALLGTEVCAHAGMEHKTPKVARLLIIPPPPPPPAPAGSAEFALVPAPALWNRTTPAKCAPRRRTRLHRWRSLPVPATAECSRPSKRVAPARHCSVAHRRPGLPAECAPPAATLPRDGYRLRRPRN